MITMFIPNGIYLLFCIVITCPEPLMCISALGSFPMQAGGSLFSVPFGVGSQFQIGTFYLHCRCRHKCLFVQVLGPLGTIGMSGEHLDGC